MLFVSAGKIQTIVLDSETGLLECHDTNFFCNTKKKAHDITDIRDVRCFKRGHEGVQFYTVRYIMQVEFKKEKPLKILESGEKRKVVRQTVMIKNFLGFTCTENEVRIFDESSRL